MFHFYSGYNYFVPFQVLFFRFKIRIFLIDRFRRGDKTCFLKINLWETILNTELRTKFKIFGIYYKFWNFVNFPKFYCRIVFFSFLLFLVDRFDNFVSWFFIQKDLPNTVVDSCQIEKVFRKGIASKMYITV